MEELLNPEGQPPSDGDLAQRHLIGGKLGNGVMESQGLWMHRMITTPRPLEEKMTLFWHSILCTGDAKVDHGRTTDTHISLLREHALGYIRDMLLALSRDPAMVIYLANRCSHKDAPNENYGRELLELFSMGGNYTE